MRKVYLEGMLGEKFGAEWNLAVNSPAEAMQAIAAQRSGFKQYLIEGENIQGYDVLVGDQQVGLDECMLIDPNMTQSYTFAPVIAGSKNAGLMLILGVALVVMTGGAAAVGLTGMMGGGGAIGAAGSATLLTSGSAAYAAAATAGHITAAGIVTASGAVAGTTAAMGTTAALALSGAQYLGMGLLLGGASMLLAPDVPDGSSASKAENYLFSGPVNTVKQGSPIPLVYGRMITGSKTIMGSLFTTSSNNESHNLKTRKLVGIGGFRNDGDKHGNNGPAGAYNYGGYYGYGGRHGGQYGGQGYH
jgi:predicted phage tail protein